MKPFPFQPFFKRIIDNDPAICAYCHQAATDCRFRVDDVTSKKICCQLQVGRIDNYFFPLPFWQLSYQVCKYLFVVLLPLFLLYRLQCNENACLPGSTAPGQRFLTLKSNDQHSAIIKLARETTSPNHHRLLQQNGLYI